MPLVILKLMQKLQTRMISSFKRLLILPTLRFRIEDECLSGGIFKLGFQSIHVAASLRSSTR